jgi:serine/threonine-protein kinase
LRLSTRLLNQATATPLAGTENGSEAFFSPDGQWVGFWATGKFKVRLPLTPPATCRLGPDGGRSVA